MGGENPFKLNESSKERGDEHHPEKMAQVLEIYVDVVFAGNPASSHQHTRGGNDTVDRYEYVSGKSAMVPMGQGSIRTVAGVRLRKSEEKPAWRPTSVP